MTTPAITSVLSGLVDMHCHSGPSPFPRRFDHADAAKDGWDRLQMRAMVVKSHHHNTVMDLLAMKGRLAEIPTQVFGGIALNNQVGGLNRYAVQMSLSMGGKVVWFPTFTSGRHIDCHPEHAGFPTPTVSLDVEQIDVTDANGNLVPEVDGVLDEIAKHGAVLNGGHMYPDDIAAVFTRAKEKGIDRMVVSHPDFVIGAEPAKCRELIALGAYIEHELHMYDPEGAMKWDIGQLYRWIEELGPEHVVLSSDLGQSTLPAPVDAYLRVGEALLDMGLPEKDLQRMVRDNPSFLLNLDN
ncbi:DUF6282 family protein [Cellulomonas fimi]|uniref:Amidohydrolase 2 n=1 Tax=Cellulomonas fimi TaxID=1708 RepID=A0A7Y0QIY0_CELFI|nr:DUF6282 family protein [Cellulomonas fimi]NMR21359.1 hypothetical protein [Cellulomonas fimi]